MNALSEVSTVLQAAAAYLTFVAGYLAIAISIVVLLLMVELILERGDVVREYGAVHAPAKVSVMSEANGRAQMSLHLLRRRRHKI